MPIFDQYLCRELVKTGSVVLLVLIMIIGGNTLLRIVGDVVSGELPKDYIFILLAVSLIRQIALLIPFAFFIAVTLVIGRMYQENEIYAMHSSGIGVWLLIKKLLWVLLPLLLLLLWLALFANPWAKNYQDDIWEKSQQRLDINTILPGQFNRGDDKQSVIFFEKFGVLDNTEQTTATTAALNQSSVISEASQSAERATRNVQETMENVFLAFTRDNQKITQSAQSASKYIDQENGNLYFSYQNGQLKLEQTEGYGVIDFDQHAILLKEKVITSNRSSDVSALPSAVLLSSQNPRYQAELQFRLAIPLGAFLLLMLAVPLCRIAPRKGRYSKLGNAILLFFLFFYVVNLLSSWLAEGLLSPVPGLFVTTIVLLLLLLILLAINEGWRLPRLRKVIK